jgi:hypothetical protein
MLINIFLLKAGYLRTCPLIDLSRPKRSGSSLNLIIAKTGSGCKNFISRPHTQKPHGQMFTPWNAKLIPLGRSLFLWGEAYSSGAKLIPLGRSLFLWGEGYFSGAKVISLGRRLFLPDEVAFYGTKPTSLQ